MDAKNKVIQEVLDRIAEIKPYGTHALDAIHELRTGLKWFERVSVWVDGDMCGVDIVVSIGS